MSTTHHEYSAREAIVLVLAENRDRWLSGPQIHALQRARRRLDERFELTFHNETVPILTDLEIEGHLERNHLMPHLRRIVLTETKKTDIKARIVEALENLAGRTHEVEFTVAQIADESGLSRSAVATRLFRTSILELIDAGIMPIIEAPKGARLIRRNQS